MNQNKKFDPIGLIVFVVCMFFLFKAFYHAHEYNKILNGNSSSVSEASQPKIILPSTPKSLIYDNYSSVSEFTVNNISCTYDNIACTVTVSITLDSKVGSENTSESLRFGYKLYDSTNTVIDSDNVFTPSVSVGEKTETDFNIYDLKPNETYTLEILPSK